MQRAPKAEWAAVAGWHVLTKSRQRGNTYARHTRVKRVTDPREERAYYEAGHAVISMKLGYRCLYVTITPDGDRLGHACQSGHQIGRLRAIRERSRAWLVDATFPGQSSHKSQLGIFGFR